MAGKRNGLGKGLDSLIPNKTVKEESASQQKVSKEKQEKNVGSGEILVKINEVEPNREQPRKEFDEDSLMELADSIRQFGILQPLLVQKVAERVSKSRTAVTNSMRLLKLSERVQQMIVDDMISTGHARALLALDDEEQQYILANKIFDEKLSVRETEKLVKALKNPKKEVKVQKREHMFVYNNLEEHLKNIIGTKVSVNPKANGKGKIEIEYYSEEELERIYDLIMSIQSK